MLENLSFKTPSEQGCRNSIAIPADTVCRDLANIVHPDCSAARRFCCRDVLLIHYISHISFRFLPSDWRWRISFPNASAARWISIALCTAPIFQNGTSLFGGGKTPVADKLQYAAVADVGFRPPNQNQLLFPSVHAFEFAVMLFKSLSTACRIICSKRSAWVSVSVIIFLPFKNAV